jgi:hypothetical protein
METLKLDAEKSHLVSRNTKGVGIAFAEISGKLNANSGDGDLGFEVEHATLMWNAVSENRWQVIFPMVVSLRETTPAGHRPFAVLRVVIVAGYEFEPLNEAQTDALPHFLAINGMMHVWPYLRAEVQSLTTKLSVPPLTLPMLFAGSVEKFVSMPSVPAKMPEPPATDAASAVKAPDETT